MNKRRDLLCSVLSTILLTLLPQSKTAAQRTALATLADAMAPGSWAQLSVSNQNSVLGVGSVSGSMTHYMNSAAWNPVAKKMEIIGMDHNWGSTRYAQFDEVTNSFIEISGDVGFGSSTKHGYDHNAVNPTTGIVYNRFSTVATGAISIRYTTSGSANFSSTPSIATGYDQIAIASAWWSGPFVGAGTQGAFFIFNSGDSNGSATDGHMVAWDPVKNAWIFDKHGVSPNYLTGGSTYHPVMEYSPQKNVAVYGGGNDAPTKLWRMDSRGDVATMPDVPAGTSVGIQKGNFVNDPVSGNFLLMSERQLWELNPDGAGSWTRKTDPPSGVGTVNYPIPDGIVSSAIPEYGVVAYIKQTGRAGGTFFLYKPTGGSGPSAPAAPRNLQVAP